MQPGSNTIQIFAIDPTAPANITKINGPEPSGGEFPSSATFNKDGTALCVLNGGAVSNIQHVIIFRITTQL
jgi:hypothetical protein